MSFAGDLEHLPIVDVIQLLHSTKKSGTLYLKSHKGESQLTFSDGYIVSANHVQNTVRIGQILVETGAITPEQLDQALHRQKNIVGERKPLIATLIEEGFIDRQTAFSGLEALIEMTIVEILTWNSGTFSLDVDATLICDEYRYFPDTLKQEISLNTQNILMDALRIYDEKMRDGTLQQGTFLTAPDTPQGPGTGALITEDLLGLDSLDRLEKKIPDVFLGLKEYDAAEVHRQKLRESGLQLPQAENDRLISQLLAFPPPSGAESHRTPSPLAVVVFSSDPFMEHLVATVCRHEGIFVVSTDDESNLEPIIDQSFAKELSPLLVIDAPLESGGPFSPPAIIALARRKREKYPQMEMLQLVSARDGQFPLLAMQSGVRNVLARPVRGEQHAAFTETAIGFVKHFHHILQKTSSATDQRILARFKECIHELESLRKIPDVAFVVLKFAAAMFERTLTLVVGTDELIAEKGFGITADRGAGASEAMMFTIPLHPSSVFRDVVRKGNLFYGPCNDLVLREHLHANIGTPRSPKMLLMPVKTFGRVIALIYGDFGELSGSPLQIDLLDIVARHAGLVLENGLYRKKLASLSHQGAPTSPSPQG